MYYLDHDPPNFQAAYNGAEAQSRIHPRNVLRGSLPPRALALTLEWATIHQSALLDNWHRLHHDESPISIDPLE